MHAFSSTILVALAATLAACGSPSPQCVGEGVSLLQQGSFTTSPNQMYCQNVNSLLVLLSNNTCDPSDTFEYISNNAEEIINNSLFAGMPEQLKKDEAERWAKSADSVVKMCDLN